MQTKTVTRLAILTFLAGLIIAFYLAGGKDLFTLDYIQQQQARFLSLFQAHTLLFSLCFFLLYIACTALSLPVATLLTLLAGAIFGFGWGLFIASFASTIGATIAFLIARFLFRDAVQQNYGDKLAKLNQGFEKEGNFYLFALRLVPVFPFFVINIVMGLTPIKAWHYYAVSQLGMLPGTAVYVYAGTALASISSLGDITSPNLLVAFTLLGLFPIIAKKAVSAFRTQHHEA